ncbi:uncharacterized protein LOC135501439 isoform X2 [Lineus longissimus]|uniref:uncharacterized protein LOC135501439 isoform X2 n=1 Tax=Lineus longissimus TaxID=88925 RepID=UPI00315C6D06
MLVGRARTAWLYNTSPGTFNRKRPESPSLELSGQAVPLRHADQKNDDYVMRWSWARTQDDYYSRSRPPSRAMSAPPIRELLMTTPAPSVKQSKDNRTGRQRPQSARPAWTPTRRNIPRPKSSRSDLSHSSMTFDAIKDVLVSEGMGDDVSSHYASRANTWPDDETTASNAHAQQRTPSTHTHAQQTTLLSPRQMAQPERDDQDAHLDTGKASVSRGSDRLPKPEIDLAWLSARFKEIRETEGLSERPKSSPLFRRKETHEQSSFHDHRQCCCDLDSRRSQRVQRSRPWTIGMISTEGIEDPTTQMVFRSEIERTRWKSEQTMEKSLTGPDTPSPRLVLMSSNIKKVDLLVDAIKKEDDILVITYDFETWDFDRLLEEIRKKLEEYRPGCRAKSILLYCQGGPGFLYLLRNRVLTPQKLVRRDQPAMKSFFNKLGGCMSKLNPAQTVIYVLGCFFLGNKQGYKVFEELHKTMLPNSVRFESPPELSVEGREVVQTYFDIRRYKLWRLMRQAHFSNAEWFKELQCKVPEALREHKEEQRVDAADLEIDHDDENGQPSGKQASDPSVNN